jgi:hypothetical protein
MESQPSSDWRGSADWQALSPAQRRRLYLAYIAVFSPLALYWVFEDQLAEDHSRWARWLPPLVAFYLLPRVWPEARGLEHGYGCGCLFTIIGAGIVSAIWKVAEEEGAEVSPWIQMWMDFFLSFLIAAGAIFFARQIYRKPEPPEAVREEVPRAK